MAVVKGSPVNVSRGERPMEAGRSATAQLQEARAEARAATARAAEAEARLAAAQKQLHTVRGGASAAQTALQEEIQSLKVRPFLPDERLFAAFLHTDIPCQMFRQDNTASLSVSPLSITSHGAETFTE